MDSEFIRAELTPEIRELVLEKGRRFIPATLPDDIKRWPPAKCFDASAIQALHSKGKYGYVEGVALDPERHDQWIVHGWMTDGVYAYDPTWLAIDNAGKHFPLPTMYVGIPMDVEAVGRFMMATTYQGVMNNRWRNPKLADIAIHSLFTGQKGDFRL